MEAEKSTWMLLPKSMGNDGGWDCDCGSGYGKKLLHVLYILLV